MLNTVSLNAVSSSKFSQQFVKPLYDSYCFSNIPQTITHILTGEGESALPLDVFGGGPTSYDRVILFFVDAFGLRFFERYAEKYEFLKIMLKQGVVSKMTSQFPSTTAAHATCIHTGLNLGQSGVYEWQYYEPLVDDVIMPLLFSYARDKERNTLKKLRFPQKDIILRSRFTSSSRQKAWCPTFSNTRRILPRRIQTVFLRERRLFLTSLSRMCSAFSRGRSGSQSSPLLLLCLF